MRFPLLLLLVLGCGGEDPPPRARGAEGLTPSAPAQPTAAEQRSGDLFRAPSPDRRPGVSPGDLRPIEIATQRPVPHKQAPERDFARELQAAAGSPTGCGSLGGITGEFRIPLTASISVQGVVTRASVGGRIPAETRECMKQKIEAYRFAAPIPGGPRSISATLVVTGTAAETMTEETSAMTGFALQPGQQAVSGPSGTMIGGGY